MTVWTTYSEEGDRIDTAPSKREALQPFGGEIRRVRRIRAGLYEVETMPYAGFDRFYFIGSDAGGLPWEE